MRAEPQERERSQEHDDGQRGDDGRQVEIAKRRIHLGPRHGSPPTRRSLMARASGGSRIPRRRLVLARAVSPVLRQGVGLRRAPARPSMRRGAGVDCRVESHDGIENGPRSMHPRALDVARRHRRRHGVRRRVRFAYGAARVRDARRRPRVRQHVWHGFSNLRRRQLDRVRCRRGDSSLLERVRPGRADLRRRSVVGVQRSRSRSRMHQRMRPRTRRLRRRRLAAV